MIILRFVFFISLFTLISGTKPLEKKSEKIELAHLMLKNCAKTLSQRHQLAQCGAGGAMMYEIEDLTLAFYIYRSLTKEEARAILIDCAKEVITTVNQNKEIQKYLLAGGFTEKSVQIQIFIKPNHKKNYYPDLGVCSYDYGRLNYETYDPNNKYKYKTEEKETYQEAIALLNKYENRPDVNEAPVINTNNPQNTIVDSALIIFNDKDQPIITAHTKKKK